MCNAEFYKVHDQTTTISITGKHFFHGNDKSNLHLHIIVYYTTVRIDLKYKLLIKIIEKRKFVKKHVLRNVYCDLS